MENHRCFNENSSIIRNITGATEINSTINLLNLKQVRAVPWVVEKTQDPLYLK